MNDLTDLRQQPPSESSAWLAEFHSMTTEDLKTALADSLGLTAKSLLRSACLVHVLEERGEDLTGLRIGMLNHLKKIACGQLLPEVVVRFAGKPSLIAVVGNLPIDQQCRLAAGDAVQLLVYGDDGKRTIRNADPLVMTPRQVMQVFARDHVRNQAEQALILDERRERASLPVPAAVGKMKIDKERGGVIVGRQFIPLVDLVAAVKALQ